MRLPGLSEAGAQARAHAMHPITALQSEYSLWERNLQPHHAAAARAGHTVPSGPVPHQQVLRQRPPAWNPGTRQHPDRTETHINSCQ